MSASSILTTLKSTFNIVFRKVPTVITSSGLLPEDNLFFVEVGASDIDIDLRPAADYPNEEIYIKRRSNGSNAVRINTAGVDTFENDPGFTVITLAARGEYVKLKANAAGYWEILDRNTIGVGALGVAAATTFDVGITPVKFNVFDTILATTDSQVEASDVTDDVIIQQIEDGNLGDPYEISISVSIEYDNGRFINAQLYQGGVPIPTAFATDTGQGNNNPVNLGINTYVVLQSPTTLEMRVWGEVVAAGSPVEGAAMIIRRVKG